MTKNYLNSIQLMIALFVINIGYSQKINVSDDAFVRGSSSYNTINYNGQSILIKSTNSGEYRRRAYMKFDLSEYSSITSATLNFSGKLKAGDVPFTITIYSIADADDGWSETTITDATDPDLTALPVTFNTGSNTDYALYSVDLTAHVQAELSTGNKIISIGFKDADKTNDQFEINDKEAGEDIPNDIITANITLVGGVLKVEDNELLTFSMYPNPTHNLFEIRNVDSKISSVEVFTVSGSSISKNINVNSNSFNKDVSSFKQGVYFVKVTNMLGESSVRKLVKE